MTAPRDPYLTSYGTAFVAGSGATPYDAQVLGEAMIWGLRKLRETGYQEDGKSIMKQVIISVRNRKNKVSGSASSSSSGGSKRRGRY